MTPPASLAVFISSHGFGHATRACAVMERIRERNPRIGFDIFTAAAGSIFEETLAQGFRLHPLLTDIGLVQKNPFQADLEGTLKRLEAFVPFDPATVDSLAEKIRRLGCRAVLCDISALGLVVARAAKVPSVLMENFTWDWIYEEYAERFPAILPYAEYFSRVNALADAHVQAEPVCRAQAADLTAGPVSRKLRTGPAEVRKRLGVPDGLPLILISTGGVAQDHPYIDSLRARPDLFFVIANAGAAGQEGPNVVRIPAFSAHYHPDLVNAADVLIGKAGYSTVAEACRAGVPFGVISRPDFRESPVLVDYVRSHLPWMEVGCEELPEAGWLSRIDRLLGRPRRPPRTGGAGQVADFILPML